MPDKELDPAAWEERQEWLRKERDRYEYLLRCAEHSDSEELAFETIGTQMTVEDFVAAAKEVLRARKAHDKLIEFHDGYDSSTDDRFKVRGRLYRILAEWDRDKGAIVNAIR